MIKITFPDGNVREYPKGTSALDIAKSISRKTGAPGDSGTCKWQGVGCNTSYKMKMPHANSVNRGIDALMAKQHTGRPSAHLM